MIAAATSSVRPPSRRGFTLIEMTAVLVLTAVLAGVAAVSLAGPKHRAAAADAVEQVTFADAQVRRSALASDRPAELLIDLAAGRLARSSDDGGVAVTLADLPGGVRVSRVLIGTDVVDAGQARVPISAGGRSRSYAVGLATPAGPRWTVVAGLTGQATPAADEAEADAVLAAAPAGD